MSLQAEHSIDNILLTYLHKNTFTGCAVGLSSLKERVFNREFYYKGSTDKGDLALPIDRHTLFDLASLTKPLVTVLCILALKKDGKVSFEDPLEQHCSFALPVDKKEIRVIDLLRHTSGLPAHRPYFNELRKSAEIIELADVVQAILQEKLVSNPGDQYLYSDLDYILLGYLIEKLSGESIGSYWQRKIIEPLGLVKEFFWVGGKKKDKKSISFAVTGVCGWTGSKLCGEVHDDNCRAMNRLSGHAGLFGTLTGVMALCEELLLNYSGSKENSAYNREDILYLLHKRKRKNWAYGFDVPTGENPSSGKYFSQKTIGHLGYTGTSFWIDLDKKRIVVVLTNRVVYGDDNKNIKEMRPRIHDALLNES